MEPTNQPFRKENYLNQTSMIMFHVNLQGCIFETTTWFPTGWPDVQIYHNCHLWTEETCSRKPSDRLKSQAMKQLEDKTSFKQRDDLQGQSAFIISVIKYSNRGQMLIANVQGESPKSRPAGCLGGQVRSDLRFWTEKNMDLPIGSMGRTVYLPTWIVDFYGFPCR